MKILLDECLPKRLKSFLSEFEVFTATEMGWTKRWQGVELPRYHGAEKKR